MDDWAFSTLFSCETSGVDVSEEVSNIQRSNCDETQESSVNTEIKKLFSNLMNFSSPSSESGNHVTDGSRIALERLTPITTNDSRISENSFISCTSRLPEHLGLLGVIPTKNSRIPQNLSIYSSKITEKINFDLSLTCSKNSEILNNSKLQEPQEMSMMGLPERQEVCMPAEENRLNELIEKRIQDSAISTTIFSSSHNWQSNHYQNNQLLAKKFDGNMIPLAYSSESCSNILKITDSFPSTSTLCRKTDLCSRSNVIEDWPVSKDQGMRSRPCFSVHQTRELEREFNVCQYVTRRRRIELAYILHLTEKQIKTWFQNRRVKERKEKRLTGSELN